MRSARGFSRVKTAFFAGSCLLWYGGFWVWLCQKCVRYFQNTDGAVYKSWLMGYNYKKIKEAKWLLVNINISDKRMRNNGVEKC